MFTIVVFAFVVLTVRASAFELITEQDYLSLWEHHYGFYWFGKMFARARNWIHEKTKPNKQSSTTVQ